MRDPQYSSIDPKTGNVTFSGPSEVMKGDHSHMPSRTAAYQPGDERGHVQASSLGGTNSPSNVVPQSADVNHAGYYSLESGERSALQGGASIQSEKTAIVNGHPGDRPSAFQVNDTVTYADGHTETLHLSFANESYAAQQAWNEASAALPDTFSDPAPGGAAQDAMSPDAYAQLMEETDACLPNIDEEYAPADSSGVPSAEAWDSSISADGDTIATDGASVSADAESDGIGADAGDCGSDPDPD